MFYFKTIFQILSIPLVAVTQCRLSWMLLASLGCSAVSSDDYIIRTEFDILVSRLLPIFLGVGIKKIVSKKKFVISI